MSGRFSEKTLMPALKKWNVLRPLCLAKYMASSACATSSSPARPSAGYRLMPMLADVWMGSP